MKKKKNKVVSVTLEEEWKIAQAVLRDSVGYRELLDKYDKGEIERPRSIKIEKEVFDMGDGTSDVTFIVEEAGDPFSTKSSVLGGAVGWFDQEDKLIKFLLEDLNVKSDSRIVTFYKYIIKIEVKDSIVTAEISSFNPNKIK